MCTGYNEYESTREEKDALLKRAEKRLEERLADIRRLREAITRERERESRMEPSAS